MRSTYHLVEIVETLVIARSTVCYLFDNEEAMARMRLENEKLKDAQLSRSSEGVYPLRRSVHIEMIYDED